MGTEVHVDPLMGSFVVENTTDLPTQDIMQALQLDPEFAAISRWVAGTQRKGGLLERDRYVSPTSIYDEMRVAQEAAQNDDIVAGVVEATESLAFNKVTFEVFDEDEENIWNQILVDLDLEARLREMWRELFTVSQFYAFTWWGRKTYRVTGRNSSTNVRRKREFRDLVVPVGISLLDPLKVLPVGSMMFNQERLVYLADRNESVAISDALDNRSDDTMIQTMITERYEPTPNERKLIGELGVGVSDLWVLDPRYVWRHTATRPQYQRFADVRLKSIFELLDLKSLLREMDRAHMLGGTNFIVLVKKGSDALPGRPDEISNLQAQVRTLARVPVIVGDHRLNVEIVTPNNDKTLEPDRYNMLDEKIATRLYQTFISSSKTTDDSLKLARVIGRGMESRRHLLRQTIEKKIVAPVVEMNSEFTEAPKLAFHPNQIALDFDTGLASFMFDLRDRGELSRQTILAQIDLDQDDEARNRKREAEQYDEIFQTAVPFSSPGANPFNSPEGITDTPGNGGGGDPRASGRTRGGNRNGGGAAPGSGQGQPARNPRKKSE